MAVQTFRQDISKEKTAINPFKPEFTIVIFIHYKPRIATQFSTCGGWKWLAVDDKWKKVKVKANDLILLL